MNDQFHTQIPFVNLNVDIDNFKDHSLGDLYDRAKKMHDKEQLDEQSFNKIQLAIQDIIATFDKNNKEHFYVRQARLTDVDELANMISYWAQQGENLPRPRADLIRNILSFAVCVKNDVVCGCACLFVYDSGLAEIRSLGVAPQIQRQGQGRAIVEYLLSRAHKMQIKKVFVLTRNPKFFEKVGFTKTVITALPEKILKDCENCKKKDKCDEVAYEYNF